jgi:hypothetical protein
MVAVLSCAVQLLHYWNLQLKKAQGQKINIHQVEHLQVILGIPLKQKTLILQIVQKLHNARRCLKDYQKQHIELREDHLNQLATAIVLHRSPDILLQGNVQELDKRHLKEIKRILRKEMMKHIYGKVGATLKPGNHTGLSTIDVPTTNEVEPYPIGPYPKQWTGAWRSITDLAGIAKHVSAMNARQ